MVGSCPDRPSRGGQCCFHGFNSVPQRARLERRVQEKEVEVQVQLVALAVVGDELGKIEDPGLADQHPALLVGVANRAPASQHFVNFGQVGGVNGS